MTELPLSTLEKILAAAKAEFLEKGYQSASLRNIVKSAGVTTGAFYGYYSSKEALFAALVDEPYRFVLRTYRAAVSQFEQLQPQTQVLRMGDAGNDCMQALLLYMDARRDAFHLILECADGTPYSHIVDELAVLEAAAIDQHCKTLQALGHPVPQIDRRLEHMLLTGMINTFLRLSFTICRSRMRSGIWSRWLRFTRRDGGSSWGNDGYYSCPFLCVSVRCG